MKHYLLIGIGFDNEVTTLDSGPDRMKLKDDLEKLLEKPSDYHQLQVIGTRDLIRSGKPSKQTQKAKDIIKKRSGKRRRK